MALQTGQVRTDYSTVSSKIRRTQQGGILAESRPTKTGIFTYNYPGGKQVREFRPEEEVFHPDSLASLAGAPVTVMHPTSNGGLVNAKTWRDVARGHVCDDVKRDGDYVASSVRILDEDTIDRIEKEGPDQLREMSCGYTADLDFTPGEFDGQHYDAIQKNIRYNHVALLPRNAGRAGRDVGLRLDGAAYALDMDVIRMDDAAVAVPPTVLDAKDFVSKAEYDTVKGQLAAATAQLAEVKTKLDAAEVAINPVNIDKLVQKRTDLITRAKAIVPAKTRSEFKTDGLSDLEIMVSAIKASGSTVKLDAEDWNSAACVKGVFSQLATQEAEVATAHAVVQEGLSQVAKTDAVDQSPKDPYTAFSQRRRDEDYKAFNGTNGSN